MAFWVLMAVWPTSVSYTHLFAITSALREKRSRNNYRGVKINDNVYSGFLQCGDCGSPMSVSYTHLDVYKRQE